MSDIDGFAKESAGNWKVFNSFVWFRENELEDADNWTIINTNNRDADILTQSNHAAISKSLAPFMQGDNPDVVEHGASHWGVGWVEGFEIRVYDSNGDITDAFKEYYNIVCAMADYPVLDDSDHSDREYEAAIEAIKDIGYNLWGDIIDAPEDWASKVFSWLWTNDQSELENTDGNGASPSKESVRNALESLGMIEKENDNDE